MVKPLHAVQPTGAGTEIPGQYIPALVEVAPGKGAYVNGIGTAFQPMAENGKSEAFPDPVIGIGKIAIAQRDFQTHWFRQLYLAEKIGKQRLYMTSGCLKQGKPCAGMELPVDFHLLQTGFQICHKLSRLFAFQNDPDLFWLMILLRSAVLSRLIVVLFLAISVPVHAQKVPLVLWSDIESFLAEPSDSVTVMNFWASWCRPCVAELPHFEKLRKENKFKNVRWVYVSLDFADEKAKSLEPVVEKKLQGARVWLLNETDYNQWMGKIDEKWSGSIPATLFYNHSTKKRIFAEAKLSESKLLSLIKEVSLKPE